MPMNVLQDTLWLPVALAMPWYVMLLALKVTKFRSIKMIVILVSAVIFLLGLARLPLYFQYLFCLFVPLFVLLVYQITFIGRPRLHLLFYLVAVALLIANYRGQLFPNNPLGQSSRATTLQIASYNISSSVRMNNRSEILQFVRTFRPDIIAIQEITSADRKLLKDRLDDLYPYQLWSERFENYNGGVIFSRLPFYLQENINIRTPYSSGHINLNHAVVSHQGQKVHIFNCHLYHGANYLLHILYHKQPPANFRKNLTTSYLRHIDEAEQIAELVFKVEEPVILMGDFNDTPKSPVYRLFRTRLRNAFSDAGWGLGTTFGHQSLIGSMPSFLKFLVFDFLRIDHVFCSSAFRITQARVILSDASDHRPQIVDLVLNSTAATP